MQGLQHQQQQLVALLTAALPKDASSKAPATSSSSVSSSAGSVTPSPEEDESQRLAAINSLHRAILYPHNSLLVTHSASYLAQGFSQLLTDKSYSVRRAAATAYGALCSLLCSFLIAANGRQNHAILGSLIDRFIGWSLPSLRNIVNGTSELALESLHEFLNVGEVGAVERYALPILKAGQELLEDERTSMSLLPRLLSVLTMISLKFFRCFQPHFMDIVDLLLGWAMVPDITEPNKLVIMDGFLQFQKHWVNNMQFSLGLLSKFLGDMDVLIQDGSPGTSQQFKRLLALLSCFCTVLQSLASGLLEINLLHQIAEPLSQMVPVLLGCLSMIGRKFGWSKWIEDSWRCLTLLAEILSERFSTFYPIVVDTLFQSLEVGNANLVSSLQVHGVLKTNLQLLSLQKLGLVPSSVHKVLQFDGPISQLRLHPNQLVTGSAAATYIFLLQHVKNDVVENTIDCLFEELQLLKHMLEKISGEGDELELAVDLRSYSKSELVVLIKFDWEVLLSCVSLSRGDSLIERAELDTSHLSRAEKLVAFELDTSHLSRAEKLVAFLTDKFDPFHLPIQSVTLQVILLRVVERLAAIEFKSKCSAIKQKSGFNCPEISSGTYVEDENVRALYPKLVFRYLRRYMKLLVNSLDMSSPLAIKLEALRWIDKFCENIYNTYRNSKAPSHPCQAAACGRIIQDLLFSLLGAASDREPEVRSLVATALEMLLKAKLIHPFQFPIIAEVILEKLGDPEKDIKHAYLKLLSHVLPVTIYICGLRDSRGVSTCQPQVPAESDRFFLLWKQIFALKQLPQQLHSQQLVSILSYISQRWKVPLSSWIERLIHTCRNKKHHPSTQSEEAETFDSNGLWWDVKVEEDILERICSVNRLAGAWWAIHEAARFCITTRLRTNLGGPTQTFAALERMLLDVSHVLQLETNQNDGAVNIIGSYAHLLPMRLLLEFVEALKKNAYNAYEGSIILPHASQSSCLFFKANKKVCEEWFSRISEPMIDAGLALQCHDSTVHYCTLRLQEISNIVASALSDKSRIQMTENLQNIRGRYAGDILRIVQNLALALCKNREPDALVGLQKWATSTFSYLLSDGNQGPSDEKNWGHFSFITGLVYQAGGLHEKAAAHFINLLQTEESLTSMGSDGVQFAIARIIDSYTAISDWESLESWLLELQTVRAKNAGKSYSGALTTAGNEINSIQALARFDEGDFQAAWSYLDLTPKSSNELTLDPKLALQRSEQMLLQAMLLHAEGKVEKVSYELQKAKLMLEETFSVLPLDGLVEAAPHVNQLYCISAFGEACNLGDSQGQPMETLLSTYIQTVQFPCDQVHQDCSLWLKVLRVCRKTMPTSPVTFELCKSLVILARKQRNLVLATRLNNYLKIHAPLSSDKGFNCYITSSVEYEDILLMQVKDKPEDALKNLWSFVHPCMVSSSNAASDSRENVLKAKACLKLSKWLQGVSLGKNWEEIVLEMPADFKRSEISSPVKEPLTQSDSNLDPKSGISLVIEELVGTARKLSTLLCPKMGKSWILYASWCYTQAIASVSSNGKTALRSCSFSPILTSEIQPERFVLTDEEKLRVKEIIRQLISERSYKKELFEGSGDCNWSLTEYIKKELFEGSGECNWSLTEYMHSENELNSLWQKIIDIIETTVGIPGTEDCSSNNLSDEITSQLQSCIVSANITLGEARVASVVTNLIGVWWCLRRRRVSLFGQAAQAFLNYLSFSSSKSFDGQLCSSDDEPEYKYVSYTLRAMLYVLHILVNYGFELKDILEPALLKVPLLPWQDIATQLFARLSSHPDKVVRMLLEKLLLMLAELSPWSLIYPTLVDANSPEKEPSEELQKILAYLLAFWDKFYPDPYIMLSDHPNLFVWRRFLTLKLFSYLLLDVMRRINLLKEEAGRIAQNKTLTHGEKHKINAAKYSAMMAPIVVVLERRLVSTSRRPETPHESWFFTEYQEQIKSAITKFKTPPTSVVALADVWRPFEAIATSLATDQRKSSISFGEVSPQLASLMSSNAPMPGLEKQIMISEPESGLDSFNTDIVTVASFSEQLTILPTKTKPKKLIILGSNGLKYTYLLKGREDLRLDARIMQLLQSVNGFLQSSSATRWQSVGVRYYSVTPLSGRAGLIQWVENVISIYSVFKSWQNRYQLQQLSALGADTKNAAAPPVPRPSDMFYGKIIPALKEKGIRRVISRRDWPHDVKRKVLLDLMSETPKQLLHQELWCASEGFKAFSSKLKRFSGSVAAMSIVGHILGLGDRHLDNILIDFCSGDIVHIDYNVCFDKGQRLKIPEIVPFRLTQTIESTLGLTGIEGSFRADCEAVLGVLRRNKDILLMLLEVFVWDPLVEWTHANFHDDAAVVGEERKGMELAVSLSLFASRVQEIRVPLQEHHDLLLSTLPAVESAMERFWSILNQYEIVSNHFYRADQERSNLIQHESSAKSVVAEATSHSEKSRVLFEVQVREITQEHAMLIEKGREAAAWAEQHGRIIDALRSSSIPEIKSRIRLGSLEEALSLSSAVIAAGVPLSVVPEPTQIQCHEVDTEVSQLAAELDSGLSTAVSALQMYSLALQRILPLNYLATSPVHCWSQLLLSLNNLSSEVVSAARSQGAEIVSGHTDRFAYAKNNYDDLCLKATKYAADIDRLEEECEELVVSIGPEMESKAKERLLSAFMNYLNLTGSKSKDEYVVSGPAIHEETKNMSSCEQIEKKKKKLLNILDMAVSNYFSDVKYRLRTSLDSFGGERITNSIPLSGLGSFCSAFEEQMENCVLVLEFLDELKSVAGLNICEPEVDANRSNTSWGNWASTFKNSIICSKNLVENIAEVVVPSLIKSVISFNSDVMDIFGSISQIRGSVDAALEQLIQVELERASLTELESDYFVKVGLITERQLALEEAAVRGRDNLSWEEAEELASQEEACRVQLDRLHQTWNQKDLLSSSLSKREESINSALVASELQLQSLVTAESEMEPHVLRRKALLAKLIEPFSELELVDQALMSPAGPVTHNSDRIPYLVESINSGRPISEYIWKFPGLSHNHAFFIWKVIMVDLLLDSCVHDVATSFDQNLGFDQLVDVVKRKLRNQFQEHVSKYLRDRVASVFLSKLDREVEVLRHTTEPGMATGQMPADLAAVKRVQLMLEEYCSAHETLRAAESAVSIMKRQVNELKDALLNTRLEIAQLEWMYDAHLRPLEDIRLITRKYLSDIDSLLPLILNTNRPNLLESMRSSVAKIARSLECLQSCEVASVTAEGQLERAMSWACGGPNSSSAGNAHARNSGIPPEFHDHLINRRKLLLEARENASDIMKVCISLLEFEGSRDGIFRTSTGADGVMWQQSYLSAIKKFDITYHSFIRAEKEWKIAQRNMEAASGGLLSATSELSVASVRARTASGDLQSTLLTMRESAYDASVALSLYGRIIGGHNALTSECGSMLEEVLAITEGLHDIHSLGKESAVLHSSLMEELSKANAVLIPLESLLSKDVAAMTDAMGREKETKSEISPIHGQAIFQSYHNRVEEALRVFKPLVPSLTASVKGLYSLLTKLAKAAGLHAGNLHKALEGVGESLEVRSQDIDPLRTDITDSGADYNTQETEISVKSDVEDANVSVDLNEVTLPESGWISPPESLADNSEESGGTSAGTSIADSFSGLEITSPTSGGSKSQEKADYQTCLPSGVTEERLGSSPRETHSENKQESSDFHSGHEEVKFVLNHDNAEGLPKHSFNNIEAVGQGRAGKNAYAVSILRRVEMKLDGRDITDNRHAYISILMHLEISIGEQVDFLLRQATNIDNLCNMYEGWTPWI
ncbi:Serine/threonine-protein kinase TOR [Striga hermonthica]|uniref:non-specific serine/threonine protein kinase n=1 Tax=Striga hermonthica TaxID=68872 RepID=A0A9N7MIS7_STRHE|nr:Serine/threonine-protein kinase TOR [Striga hermonthica]